MKKIKFLIKEDRIGFTLTEIVVVLMLLVVIVAFAIPDYTESHLKSKLRHAQAQMQVVHGANILYRSFNGRYLKGFNLTLENLNDSLNLNLIYGEGETYDYDSPVLASTSDDYAFTIINDANGTNMDFTLKLTDAPLSETAPANPCCVAGNCLTIPNC